MRDTIKQILSAGESFRLGEPPSCTVEDVTMLETELDVKLPEGYRQFVALNGFDELNFEQMLLTPAEITESLAYPTSGFIPFASNGCGDLFCWPSEELPDAGVVFWDHETGAVSRKFSSFVEALRAWRRA